jgi:hypothetical protein
MRLKSKRRLTGSAAACAVLFGAVETFAQSCAMCYASAAAARAEGIRALQNGILVLLIPPLLIFAGIVVTAFRRRGGSDARHAAGDHFPAGGGDPV